MSGKTALIMAGGTGGHIFPGLAVAQELRSRGWTVHWLGAPDSMEERLVPPQGFALERVAFSGVRGKGLMSLVGMPLRLLKALQQARAVLRKVRPDVVVGMGGYITVPGGLAAKLAGVPIVLHEQNSVPGMANKLLARMAQRVFSAFPHAIDGGQWVGNPLRAEFLQQPEPAERFAGRSGPLQLLVVGGSLGAKALNEVVPKALALMAPETRPVVTHQSGAKQIDALQANYAAAGVQASLTPFIDDAAKAYADADVIVCRAGASTVTELAAVGAAAVFVPFPAAVDDHQTANARFLVDADAGWLVQQSVLTPENLAQMLENMQRTGLVDMAQKAKKMQKLEAAQAVADACVEVAR
nr:undecaprenyldiphospho-muramoylpentapeptide beta-N-acetylglucosaminyltransferase [Comamonas koreensis]